MQQDLGGPIAGDKLAAVTKAANAACDSALTGQPDGYISDPSECKYDPATDTSLLCASAGGTNSAASCLTQAEAMAMNKIWYGPTPDGTVPSPSLDNGSSPLGALAPNQLWFGLERGSRPAGNPIWDGVAGNNLGSAFEAALVLGNPAFAPPPFGQNKWQTIGYTGSPSFAEVSAAWDKLVGDIIRVSPDITAFRDRGGKLVMWHGTADSLIFPQGSINYYEAVSTGVGGYTEAQKFARLYLAPGIDHCGFGVTGSSAPVPGGLEYPNNGLIDLLQKWVENGQAPDQIAAASAPKVTPKRTRPWCLYPKKVKYVSGDVNTGNFICE